MKEEENIPTLREIIDFLSRPEIKVMILVIAVIILIYSGLKLADIYGCKENNGIYMEGGECYIPKSEEERQLILKQGFLKTGFDLDFEMNQLLVNINDTG